MPTIIPLSSTQKSKRV